MSPSARCSMRDVHLAMGNQLTGKSIQPHLTWPDNCALCLGLALSTPDTACDLRQQTLTVSVGTSLSARGNGGTGGEQRYAPAMNGILPQVATIQPSPKSARMGGWVEATTAPAFPWLITAAFYIAMLASLLVVAGPAPMMAPTDVFSLLDGGWRIVSGHAPHSDFHNAVGPLAYLLVAFGMAVGEPSLAGHVYGTVLMLVVVAPWAAWVFFGRLSAPYAFMMTLFVTTLIAAPRPLGYDPAVTTYAMVYNRYGWALLSVFAVQVLVPTPCIRQRSSKGDAASAGVLAAIVLFCKVTFFVAACGILAGALLLRPDLRRSALLTALAFVLIVAVFWLVLGINPFRYASDIAAAGGAQSLIVRLDSLRSTVKSNLWQAPLLVGLWGALILPLMARRESFERAARLTVAFGLTIAAALVLTVLNSSEKSDVPLFVVAAAIAVAQADWSRSHPGRDMTRVFCTIVIAVCFTNIIWKDARSLANLVSWHAYRAAQLPESQRFDARPLHDFVVPDTSEWRTAYWRARQVPEALNDGLTLIRSRPTQDETIAVLAYTDYFSFALGRVPPKGGQLWWDLDFNFNEAVHPSADALLGDVDIVMAPVVDERSEGVGVETVEALLRLYGSYLHEHFVEAARSQYWNLYARR